MSPRSSEHTSASRAERKEGTRRAILEEALRLTADGSVAELSLRRVARHVGISSAAVYRHFGSAEEVGLALVEEACLPLRGVLGVAVTGRIDSPAAARRTVEALLRHVREDRDHLAFLLRERVGSSPLVRADIERELAWCEAQLALEVARVSGDQGFATDDVRAVARLVLAVLVATCDRLVRARTPVEQDAVVEDAERQLRVVATGAARSPRSTVDLAPAP